MKSILLLLVILSLALAFNGRWTDFKKNFNKVYSSDAEESRRFHIFQENMRIAKALTIKNGGKAKFGVTKFSDLSKEEFSRLYLMHNINTTEFQSRMNRIPEYKPPKIMLRQSSIDWSTKGATTPVKDQGACGSCWAFSATETIESYTYLKTGKLPVLSEEQIVDCDTTCYGCGGGWPYLAYEYVKGAGGQDSEASYPYSAGNGNSGSCQFDPSNVQAKISGYKKVVGEPALQQTLQSTGPISVCVDASTWQSYQSGVLTDCGDSVDHCVQLTGYANWGKSGSYWIVRNSWGDSWGNQGFIWIQTGSDLCLIGDYATIVTI